jgi:hypothetical protein
MVLLGTIAIRLKDHRLEQDAVSWRITDNQGANDLLHIAYRSGWKL